ncbi:MAG: Rrf2 family transcriptional regulator [Thalassobaculaceae bacterium]|nr:Rrf2 family transcriptional regulator [Thalassobaculaceae bacterium]
MKLSTKSRYAVMAMCDLASSAQGRPISLAEIAQRQDISLSYLEQLFARLRRAGLVRSVRGPGGGYLPGKPIAEMRIAAIVQAVDNESPRNPCSPGAPHCCADKEHTCVTHDLWEQLGNQMLWFLNRVSVEDVLAGRVPGAAPATKETKAQVVAA